MMKGGRVEGKNLRRLKASKPFLHKNSTALYDYRHFTAFSADSVQLKKPSVGPKGLIGSPCHGAPWDLLFSAAVEAFFHFFRHGFAAVPTDIIGALCTCFDAFLDFL